MENVKGLLSAKVNGTNMFDKILWDLKNPKEAVQGNNAGQPLKKRRLKYNIYSLVKKKRSANSFGDPCFEPEDFFIKSERFGIPQARHRVILLGIRSDIEVYPDILEEQNEVAMWKVINDLPKIRSGLSKELDSGKIWETLIKNFLSNS